MVLKGALFLFLFSFISIHGSASFLNPQYIDTIAELPESHPVPDMVVTPDLNWLDEYCDDDETSRNCPFGWLDIVGFRNVARINGIDYINEPVQDAAIVQYKTYIIINGRFFLDKWFYDLRFSESDSIVTANLRATARLCQIGFDGFRFCINETLELSDSEPAPKQYDPDAEILRLRDVKYNHSAISQRLIYVNASPMVTKYIISTSAGSLTRRLQVAKADFTRKGIAYANYSWIDAWQVKGKGIDRIYEAAGIQGENTTYEFKAYTPWGTLNKDPELTNVSYQWSPEKTFSSFVFLFIFILGCSFIGIYLMRIR